MTNASLSTCIFFVTVILCSRVAHGQLSSTFYATSCPLALSVVKKVVTQAVANEKRMGASLLCLQLHDCFVQGCDGSVLLDDTSTFTGEKSGLANVNSLRGFDVIDTIKTQLEADCPGVMSCADIVAIAARDSVVLLGGQIWAVRLVRRDSTTASLSAANSNLPNPFGDLSSLISTFQSQGLSEKDMIALSGAHSIGQARFLAFRSRVYNDTNIDSTFATTLQANCPSSSGDNNLSPLDLVTPTRFDNNYYKILRSRKGLLHSDQELFNNGSADALVTTYSTNPVTFFSNFATAMLNMGNISPLTGTNGEIRKNCRAIN